VILAVHVIMRPTREPGLRMPVAGAQSAVKGTNMPDSGVKTPAEHREYVRSLARISFFFAYGWREKHPEECISDVIMNRTPLFHHALDLMRNEGESHPKWQALLARSEAVLADVRDAREFEDLMSEFVQEFADERADRSYPESVGVALREDWNVRSLKYDPPKEDLPANYCNFHIANALAPRSILEDPEHLPRCFLELMDRSEKEYGCDTLHTCTWLNDHPKWLALFPREWHDNLTPRCVTVGWTFGCWGQLVNARGTLNEKAARYLRDHGEFRYKPRSSHCSFAAMREHLTATA